MIPYRKDDWRANSDEARGRWFAARGYALCRLDIRGTGSSPGIALDEYTARETQDGYEAVEWLAAQPWCSGAVAMWGISYGGFTAIQVAALRPPHLRAIVPMYATDDRYTDDVHYIGGCVTASELSQYAVSMVAMNALPPSAEYRGAAWAADWRERLEETPVWLFEWLRQQHDGPYWRQGSLAPDYERIEVPMFLIGGWMDSYVDPVFRMMERCRSPRRALVGNWVHSFPDDAYPGPNVEWLPMMVRFLDRHLRDVDDGLDGEPAITWFRRDWAAPEPFPKSWPGEWQAAESWPPPGWVDRELWLGDGPGALEGGLFPERPGRDGVDVFPHRATTGTRASLSWGAGGPPNGLAQDLRPDDAFLPTYSSEPLDDPLDVVGLPSAILSVSASAPVATLVVRLSDVAPDGSVAQVTAGVLNLTHRRSHATPEPLEPGRIEEVAVPLRACAYRFAPGHRVRVSVASSYWPAIWPSPYPCDLSIHRGASFASRLVLPGPPDGWVSATVPAFPAEPAGVEEVGGGADDPPRWRVSEDVLSGAVTVSTFEGGSTVLPGGDVALYSSEALEMTASDADPAHARMHNAVEYRLRDHGTETRILASGTLRSTETDFHMNVALDVAIDGAPFFSRTWLETIPRRLV